jgi:hypothetical protein
MAVDLALDFATGDLAIAPNKDLDRVTGSSLNDQRIRVRLLVIQGEWVLDPTGGTLGSRLREALRMPIFRAQTEVPLLVHEALEPMGDINVTDVTCEPDPTNNSGLVITVYYRVLDESDATDSQQFSTSLTIA